MREDRLQLFDTEMSPKVTSRPSHACSGAKHMEIFEEERLVPGHMEIVHIPHEKGAPYPGLFLFTQVGWQAGRTAGAGVVWDALCRRAAKPWRQPRKVPRIARCSGSRGQAVVGGGLHVAVCLLPRVGRMPPEKERLLVCLRPTGG